MLIAVDFDGTIVEHKYPKIGNEIPFATQTLRQLLMDGHRLVLWTNREGKLLEEAVKWCQERGVEFYALNSDKPEESSIDYSGSRKILVDLFIDDRNVGGLPDWGVIYEMIKNKITAEEYYVNHEEPKKKKKSWW